ncbi:MAG: hypothetical protein RRB13_00375 [bacterium]|nr:hypothetical protein [bacterium]
MKLKHNYLDLVEEYSAPREISQFEKVMVLTTRAKDIYSGKTCQVEGLGGRKPTTQAQYEMLNALLDPVITERQPGENQDYLDYDEEDDN